MRTPQRFVLAEYKNEGGVGAARDDGKIIGSANGGAPHVAQHYDEVDMLARMVITGQMS